MEAVALTGMAYEGSNAGMRRLGAGVATEDYAIIPLETEAPVTFPRIGGLIRHNEVDLKWGEGMFTQGKRWEDYLETKLPPDARLPPATRAFDFSIDNDRHVISAKTLDTTTYKYSSKPSNIYSTISSYIDVAADYSIVPKRRNSLVTADRIVTKEIHVAVPARVTADQWLQISNSVAYGKTRGVGVVITRVK